MRVTLSLGGVLVAGTPAEPHYFENQVDHFSTSSRTYKQRYYEDATHFQGPGFPIFCIMGGEGGIAPSTGIFYPWVGTVLAKTFGALVIEPEHRFYGESLPFGNESFTVDNLRVMNTQQALADAAEFIRAQQKARGCTPRGTAGYCPVVTFGGSYPGFLSAMMRLRYSAVVDAAYSASAPMRFYTQQVQQYDYYSIVSRSAERAVPGCVKAVRTALDEVLAFIRNNTIEESTKKLGFCQPLPAYVAQDKEELISELMLTVEQAFAGLNMANYPPGPDTGMSQTCQSFVKATDLLSPVADLLKSQTPSLGGKAVLRTHADSASCFDLETFRPAGKDGRVRCGDWSGCGSGHDGEMWDYQTCTFEVEHIGLNGKTDMFPPHPWTLDWLKDHCSTRFDARPAPYELQQNWGFSREDLKATATKIIFTNGLNDGWSAGGFLTDVDAASGLITLNMPNGAHHSDLSHDLPSDKDTPDVAAARANATVILRQWLREIKHDSVDVLV
mmetsp:Transcript_13966/g.33834  ORF Transcript_13966/g.33834 Transcript_13966/m.33834 type:complete len:500 (+) Transcript_13966:63-1562(+)